MRKEMYDLIITELKKRLATHGTANIFEQEEILQLVEASIKTVMAEMLLNGTYYKSGGR